MSIRQQNQAIVAIKPQTALDSWPVFDYTTDTLEVLVSPTLKFNLEKVARDNVKMTLGASGERVTSLYVEVTFRAEMKGGGVDASGNVLEPRIGRLIQGCGFTKTVNTDATSGLVTEYVYTPTSDVFGSATKPALAIELYLGMSGDTADRFQIINAGGNFRYTGSVGQYGIMEFTFTGQLYDGPTTVTVPTVAYESTQPEPFLSANLSFDANNTFVFQSITIDSGTNIIIRKNAQTNTGIAGILLGKRNMTASFDPEATFANVYDFYAKLREGYKAEISVGPIGATTGNKYSFYAPAAQLTNVEQTSRDDIFVYDVSLLLTEINGDDELTIKFN